MKAMLRIARAAGIDALRAGPGRMNYLVLITYGVGFMICLGIIMDQRRNAAEQSLRDLQLAVDQLQRIEAARFLRANRRAESPSIARHPLRGAGPEALP